MCEVFLNEKQVRESLSMINAYDAKSDITLFRRHSFPKYILASCMQLYLFKNSVVTRRLH